MRNLLRKIVLTTAGSIKRISSGVHILNSHYISPQNLPQEVFYDLLNKISKQADFIRIEDAVRLIEEKKITNQKLIAFTFDDGYEECYTKIAPVLDEFNTNAAFFINPGYINGDDEYNQNFLKNVVHINHKQPMTWEMIKDLHQRKYIIGNHTYDHKKLVDLTEPELIKQVVDSKLEIESKIDSSCEYFAWTYGKLTDIDQKALKLVTENHKYVFSSANSEKYFSFNNKVINRRHVEGNWPISHLNYFLSIEKRY